MAKRKGSRRPRRPRFTAEEPLELAVTVPRVERVAAPGWRAALARPFVALVEALPEASHTAAGRRKARVIHAVLGGTALTLVVAAREAGLWLGLLGIAVGLSMAFVPLSGLRKARWRHGLARAGGGGERVVEGPARLRFDGTRLVVRSDDDGKVWASARPLVAPRRVVWGAHAGEAWLGVLEPGGRKRDALWLRCVGAAALLDGQPPLAVALGAHVDWTLDENVRAATLDAAGFEAVYRAIGPEPEQIPGAEPESGSG